MTTFVDQFNDYTRAWCYNRWNWKSNL